MTEKGYSERIVCLRTSLQMTIAQFSRDLSVPRSTLVGWENGKSVPIEMLKTLETKYKVNIDWFLTGKGEMFLSNDADSDGKELAKTDESRKIPLLRQKVSCGQGEEWEKEDNIEDYIDVFSLIPRIATGRHYALKASGSSMLGAWIKSGDYLIFDAQQGFIPEDDIYVFSLDGELYCKRLEFDILASKIKIFSVRVADLEKAELARTIDLTDQSFADSFRIFGRVRCWIHPNRGDN